MPRHPGAAQRNPGSGPADAPKPCRAASPGCRLPACPFGSGRIFEVPTREERRERAPTDRIGRSTCDGCN
ncbi:hypothetical protein CIW48_20370 [Methylobacterium sp. P1-11]|nr:hypothetical protein CIW48_20370 [Methylobacterium sp. P1-11]